MTRTLQVSFLWSDGEVQHYGDIARRRREEQEELVRAKALFNKIDSDRSGTLSREEVLVLAKQLGLGKLKGRLLERAFEEMDPNGDGAGVAAQRQSSRRGSCASRQNGRRRQRKQAEELAATAQPSTLRLHSAPA